MYSNIRQGHGGMTAAPLELDMQHQSAPIGQGDAKDLVGGQDVGREFHVQWLRLTHRAVEQPGGKIVDKQTNQALEGMICCGHNSTVLARNVPQQGSTRSPWMATSRCLY